MILKIFVYFFLQFFSGWTLICLFKIKEKFSFLEFMAITYGLGMGLVSLEVFLILLLGLHLSFGVVFLPWFIISFFNLFTKRFYFPLISFPQTKFSNLERFLIFAILFEIAYAFFKAILFPMESYDSVATWGIKAKAIYFLGGLSGQLFRDTINTIFHWDYPLLIPLQEMLFYKTLNFLDDAWVKSIFAFYFLSILAIFYFSLKRLLNRKSALLFTFFLSSLVQFNKYATNGYADLTLAFYYSSGFIFLYLWFILKKNDYLFLSSIFSAIGAWTKNEGIPLCFINFILLIMIACQDNIVKDKEKVKNFKKGVILFLVFMILFILPWQVYKEIHGLKGDLFIKETFSITRFIRNLNRIPIILYEYQKQFFDFKRWNLIWALFLSSFLMNFKRFFSYRLKYISVSLILVLCLYALVYIIITPKNISWHLSTTVSRLFIHFVAIVVLWLSIAWAKELKITSG